MAKRTSKNRLTGEQVLEIANLNEYEIRCLVKNYYDAQEMRKRADLQLRHLGDKIDVGKALLYWGHQQADSENFVKKLLAIHVCKHPVGPWIIAQHGVGEIIAAGLLAYIDIKQAPAVGHIWRFAGQDPTCIWLSSKESEKIVASALAQQGVRKPTEETVLKVCKATSKKFSTVWKYATQKRDGASIPLTAASLSLALSVRPYNAGLKQVCYQLGLSFVKTSGSCMSIYGRLYREQKALVIERNDAGDYAERARGFVTNSHDVRKKLAEGKLPDGNLDSQARRYAVKIFLSHLHAVMYWNHFHCAPPKPFSKAILGHAHEIPIPDMDMFPGFEEAYYGSALDRAA